jgi:hypothetical protein
MNCPVIGFENNQSDAEISLRGAEKQIGLAKNCNRNEETMQKA